MQVCIHASIVHDAFTLFVQLHTVRLASNSGSPMKGDDEGQ